MLTQVPALIRHCIKTLLDTLLIQLKCFDFNYETMECSKYLDRLEFPLELDMYPYTFPALLRKEGIHVVSNFRCHVMVFLNSSNDIFFGAHCAYFGTVCFNLPYGNYCLHDIRRHILGSRKMLPAAMIVAKVLVLVFTS